MTTAAVARAAALAARNDQRLDDAFAAIEQAAQLAPDDAPIAAMRALIAFETGRPSASLFGRARMLAPDDLMLVRSAAAAMPDAAAEQLLVETLAAHPDWLDGHKALAALRVTSGQGAAFDRSYAKACAKLPQSLPLRLAWFQARALARDWDGAAAVIGDGEQLFGTQRALTIARLYIAAESGAATNDAALFDPVIGFGDPGVDLAQVRHHLRGGRPERAEVIAQRHSSTAAAAVFWPYLSLVWRLIGDPRARWLDGDPLLVSSFDLDFSAEELSVLAATLRRLHTAHAPDLEQSVRLGTQTRGPLFFRTDPVIQAARAKLVAATKTYIANLPSPVPGHPLLGARRDTVRFAGSWSVRLQAGGHHRCHTHPMGWISSAFYVALPEPAALGARPAGWIAFGTPPPELGLALPPYRHVEPKPGRLVLFPSTMWHGTAPFDDGERLTIAFDLQRH